MKSLSSLSLFLFSIAFLSHLAFSTTTISNLWANPDCESDLGFNWVLKANVKNANFTYGYTVVLTPSYPSCYHDSFYGVAISWTSSFASVNYYSWS